MSGPDRIATGMISSNEVAKGRTLPTDSHQTNRCIGCGYDLQGIDSKVCPECGADAVEGARVAREQFVRKSIWRVAVGSVIFIAVAVYRAIYLSGQGFSPWPILFGALVLAGFTTGIGSTIAGRRPVNLRAAEAMTWVRSSFWLCLSWLVYPILEFAAHQMQATATRGMVPGDYAITEAWLRISKLPVCSALLIPVLAVCIWVSRWKTLQQQALLPKESNLGPIVFAIFAELAAVGCTVFDLGVLFIDV